MHPTEVEEAPTLAEAEERKPRSPEERDSTDASLRLVVANLALLIAAGVLVSMWFLTYTDHFPVVGGLLGLGGLFAWIAFLSNLIPARRVEALQASFDRSVLQHHRTWLAVLGIVAIFFFFAVGHATIVVSSLGDELGRVIRLSSHGELHHQDHIPPHATKKILVSTGWLGTGEYEVKLSGLPAETVVVSPFERRRLIVPSSFLSRPVLLLRPSAIVSATVERATGDPYRLVVSVNGEEVGRLDPYRGESVWVGSDADVAIPSHVQARWRLELLADGFPEAVAIRWSVPSALGENLRLSRGDEVRVRIVTADGRSYAAATARVAPVSEPRHFPQEVRIDVDP